MKGSSRLWAGVGVRCITPPIGIDMTGYGGRPTGCTSIHDDLYVRALVLQNGSRKLALVSMDVLGIDFDLRDTIRERVEAETGIDPASLLLNASHTHAGPATESLRGLGERDPDYVESFVAAVVAAVVEADSAAMPARCGVGRMPVQIGINRRQRRENDGRIVLGDNPEGVVVPHADVLRVEAHDGDQIATWFSHACHATTLGGDNLAISAEYPGVAVRVVEAITEGTALFAQGCCGDVNPRRRGSFDAVRRNGRILGGAVLMGVEAIEATEAEPILDAYLETVPLSLQKPLPLDVLERMIERFRNDVEEAKQTGQHRGIVQLRQASLDWALAMRPYSADPDSAPNALPFEVQVLRIGDFAIVGLPGEVFAEIGNAIDAASPFAQTAVLGYTNGCHGYVPTESAYALGGYEVETAIRYYGTLMFAPESDPQLREGAVQLLNRALDA